MSVDVASVEKELRKLWQGMAEDAQGPGGHPIIRSCVLNLVVFAEGEASEDRVSGILAQVTARWPARGLVLLPRPERPESGMRASVTAQCVPWSGGHKQLCSEQIILTADGGAVEDLPGAVRPLLAPEVPVVLWWRGVPDVRRPLFQRLSEISSRVIVDSARLGDVRRSVAELSRAVAGGGRWTAFTDLAWTRLIPWRAAVAGFFDSAEHRSHLAQVSAVRVSYGGKGVLPLEALLLLGWLAARLHWVDHKAARFGDGQELALELHSGTREVAVVAEAAADAALFPPGLCSVRIETRDGESLSFNVHRSGDGRHISTHVERDGVCYAGKVLRLEDAGEASLLARELEVLGRDRVFEAALAAALRWNGPPA